MKTFHLRRVEMHRYGNEVGCGSRARATMIGSITTRRTPDHAVATSTAN